MTTSNQQGISTDGTEDSRSSEAGAEPTRAGNAPVSSRTGLSELVVPGILLSIAVFLIVGTINMKLPPSVQVPGPTFFPLIVIGLLLLMALLSTVQILRKRAQALRGVPAPRHESGAFESAGFDDVDAHPDNSSSDGSVSDLDGDHVDEVPPDVPPGREPWPAKAFSDWRALGIVIGSMVICIVLLVPAGWIIAASALFWGVSYALGSRRPIFDLSVALVMASLIQLIFGAALGLNLPAGFLEGVL